MIGSSSLPLWLVEDVTWPVLWGILITGIFGFAWFISRQNKFLAAALATVVAIGAVIFVEQKIVTDREYLVNVIHEMTNAVRGNNVEGIVQFVHDDNQVLKDRIYSDVGRYKVQSCNFIGFNRKDVDTEATVPVAKMGFVVFGSGSANNSGPLTANVVVELDFEKRNEVWGMTAYRYRPSNSTSWYGGSGR